MTDFRIEKLPFDAVALSAWSQASSGSESWPVVYTLSDSGDIYVGETLNAPARLHQHLQSPAKSHLERVQIINNEKFNKSVCLDLESHLIRYFAADGTYRVLNANSGITNSNYFDRENYRESFHQLFDMLVEDGTLSRPVPEIVNSNLFKFSPFKALNTEQAVALSGVLEKVVEDFQNEKQQSLVIQGDPGTGKTIVAIYLLKLIRDIPNLTAHEVSEQESVFSVFFEKEIQNSLRNFKVALVIPQQALRKTVSEVFAMTPGLSKEMIKTPFEIGEGDEHYDLLIVDEAHRLGQRANQASAMQNMKFSAINQKIYGDDSSSHNQLDWIRSKSRHQLLLIDTAQSVKPADLPLVVTQNIISIAQEGGALFRLMSQMRVTGGADYLDFISKLFSASPESARPFGNYDLKFFDSFAAMKEGISRKDNEHGLSRMLAGFAWKWQSKKNKSAFDFNIEGVKLQWNQTATDWINSPTSSNEVGSIHTIQGYDLNYAGVIIGNDLGFDPEANKVLFNRSNYFDVKGKEDNPRLGIKYSDEDLLQFVLNIYKVLLTRGILGTYVYVSDPQLRQYLRKYFEAL
jgi:DUF2075 family protein